MFLSERILANGKLHFVFFSLTLLSIFPHSTYSQIAVGLLEHAYQKELKIEHQRFILRGMGISGFGFLHEDWITQIEFLTRSYFLPSNTNLQYDSDPSKKIDYEVNLQSIGISLDYSVWKTNFSNFFNQDQTLNQFYTFAGLMIGQVHYDVDEIQYTLGKNEQMESYTRTSFRDETYTFVSPTLGIKFFIMPIALEVKLRHVPPKYEFQGGLNLSSGIYWVW